MLSSLRELGKVEAELISPISFPIRYVVSENRAGDLVVLCYLQHREYSFAQWTKKSGLVATHFEPFFSLRINDCLDEIRTLCEKIHAAWSEGKSRDDCPRTDAPADVGADEAPRSEGS